MRRNWDEFSSALNCYGAVTAARDSCAPNPAAGGKKVLSPSCASSRPYPILAILCRVSGVVLTTRERASGEGHLRPGYLELMDM